jgi:hypothetical protein
MPILLVGGLAFPLWMAVVMTPVIALFAVFCTARVPMLVAVAAGGWLVQIIVGGVAVSAAEGAWHVWGRTFTFGANLPRSVQLALWLMGVVLPLALALYLLRRLHPIARIAP